MEFSVGQKVQAVDELGRWENGKIKGKVEADQYLVSFDGWSADYDQVVSLDSVRLPVHPVYNSIEEVSGRKTRREVKENDYLSLLRSLTTGDEVWLRTTGDMMAVRLVDRFKREVTLIGPDEDVVLHAGDIYLKKDTPCEARKKQSKKPARKPPSSVPESSASDIDGGNIDDSIQESSASDIDGGNIDDSIQGLNVYLGSSKGGHLLHCGDLAMDEFSHIEMAITDINVFKEKTLAKGFLMNGGLVDKDVVITLPSNRLQRTQTKISRKDKSMLSQMKRTAYLKVTKLASSNHHVRIYLRSQHITFLLNEEVKVALKSKSYRRSFNIGAFVIGIDEALLGLDLCEKRKVKYCLLDNTLSKLDALLGAGWDVIPREGQVLFTVEVAMSVTMSHTVNVVVKTAVCRESLPLGGNYRQLLLASLETVHTV